MSEINVDHVLEDVKQELNHVAHQLALRVVELERNLYDAKQEYKRVEKTLNMLSGNKKNGGRPKGKTSTGQPPSADQILNVMTDSEKEDWTVTEVANVTQLHPSTVGKSMAWLRENNKIRATRGVRGGGHAYATWTE
jgi:hypothetical protein